LDDAGRGWRPDRRSARWPARLAGWSRSSRALTACEVLPSELAGRVNHEGRGHASQYSGYMTMPTAAGALPPCMISGRVPTSPLSTDLRRYGAYAGRPNRYIPVRPPAPASVSRGTPSTSRRRQACRVAESRATCSRSPNGIVARYKRMAGKAVFLPPSAGTTTGCHEAAGAERARRAL